MWETLVVSLGTLAPGVKLTMEIVEESLLSEVTRKKEKCESSFNALVSK